MRFLKNKIQRAQEALKRQTAKSAEMTHFTNDLTIKIEENSIPDTDCSPKTGSQGTSPYHNQKRPRRSPTENNNPHIEPSSSQTSACLKNLAINYGKAIASFAASPLALPYLETFLAKEGITGATFSMSQFKQFALRIKSRIGGISSLRSALMVEEGDDERIGAYKRVLQAMGEVFIKYFSVNWILTGRLTHKMIYLKLRNKMLRRIQHPESFTCITHKDSVIMSSRC
jgi:hypothetical protein